MSKPREIMLVLHVYEPDGNGNWYVDTSRPGMFFYGPDLAVLLADVPLAWGKLNELENVPKESECKHESRISDNGWTWCRNCGGLMGTRQPVSEKDEST